MKLQEEQGMASLSSIDDKSLHHDVRNAGKREGTPLVHLTPGDEDFTVANGIDGGKMVDAEKGKASHARIGLRPPYFLVQNNGLYITLQISQYASFNPHHSWLFNGILIFKNR